MTEAYTDNKPISEILYKLLLDGKGMPDFSVEETVEIFKAVSEPESIECLYHKTRSEYVKELLLKKSDDDCVDCHM